MWLTINDSSRCISINIKRHHNTFRMIPSSPQSTSIQLGKNGKINRKKEVIVNRLQKFISLYYNLQFQQSGIVRFSCFPLTHLQEEEEK